MEIAPPSLSNCPGCPLAAETRAAISVCARRSAVGNSWVVQPTGTAVHVVALFRDPAIHDKRTVSTVLDLFVGQRGEFFAGRTCWMRAFLEALDGLPTGFTAALDNGVRCPTANTLGFDIYLERSKSCHLKTAAWHASLKHPDGNAPGVVICDRDLAKSLSQLGFLLSDDGTPWECPRRFLDCVGEQVRYLGVEALIAAHPVVLQRRPDYRQVFQDRRLIDRVLALAKIEPFNKPTVPTYNV